MKRFRRRWIAYVALCAIPAFAPGQNTPVGLGAAPVAPELGGIAAIDLVTLRSMSLGIPLRYGGVLAKSERVELNGRILREGEEYALDAASGIVYLKVPYRVGDSLRVQYRYDPKRVETAPAGGISGLRLDLVPGGQLGFVAGMGVADRSADGRVATSNVFGWTSNFAFSGGGGLKGLLLFSDRQQVDTESGLGPAAKPKGDDASGKTRLILQDLKTNFMGGTIEAGIQDVQKGFTAFNQVRGSGFDAKFVDQLQREQGLQRTSFGIRDVKLGDAKFSQGMRQVRDGDNGITWRNLGFSLAGFSVGMESQRIDKGFTRFKDIAEGDREQLAREAGMARERMNAGLDRNGLKLGFRTNEIQDGSGNAITQRDFMFQTAKLTFEMGGQEVDRSFSRLNSLLNDERARFGLEAGMKRDYQRLSWNWAGGKSDPLRFSTTRLSNDQGAFNARNFSLGEKNWRFETASIEIDEKFNGMGALQAPEVEAHVQSIASMVGAPANGLRPEDRQRFVQGAGISRSLLRFQGQPLAGWRLGFDRLRLEGSRDEVVAESLSLVGKNLSFELRRQETGLHFNEADRLTFVEQSRLGTARGLQKQDLALRTKLGGQNIVFNQMRASTPNGDAMRQEASVTSKNFQLSVKSREVDKGMSALPQIVDAERDALMGLVGLKQTEVSFNWKPTRSISLDGSGYDISPNGLEQMRRQQALNAVWQPNKRTKFGYTYFQHRSADPRELLALNKLERFSFSQELSKGMTLRLGRERQDFDGSLVKMPDSDKSLFALVAQLNPKTLFSSERTQTNYENGESEEVQSTTISTELSKKAGLSVTEMRADRPGEDKDESRRDVGVWVVLPNNMKVSYGYARNLQGEIAGEQTKNLSITPGQIGNVKVDSASYGEKFWDQGQRTQATSNVNLSSAKPFRLGFLTNLKFNFGFDALADRAQWQRENRVFGFSGNLGSNTLAYEYRGQMFNNGYRAIDRTFRFATDNSPKRWLTASVFYKVRTLPWDDQVMIRDFDITARPAKNLELTHRLITNPEVANGNAILGTTPQASRSNSWKLGYKANGDFHIAGTWFELANEQNKALSRTGGIEATLFASKGSPLKLFYGIEQVDGNVARRSTHRYSIEFSQKAGPNQSFNFFLGNVSYEHSIADGWKRNNWTGRLDYQLRF